MTAANLITWWLHSAVLLTVGIAGTHLLRWREPSSRLRFLQALLAAALLLPWLEPWGRESRTYLADTPALLAAVSPVVFASAHARFVPSWQELLSGVVILGVAARLCFLVWGVFRLRRWRRAGERVAVDRFPSSVEVRVVDSLANPAAFGWLAAVILLPRSLAEPSPTRDAALAHELEHVQRRDWLESVVEQFAAALIWFQPAVWWLLERIQLAREQAVDAAAARTGPDLYLQSLLHSAGIVDLPSLPVTHFVRRRHLVQRVAALTGETSMTLRHLVAAAVTLVAAATLAVALMLSYRPLMAQAPPQTVGVRSSGLRFDSLPIRTRMTAEEEGTVTLDITLTPTGKPVEIRLTSGPESLGPRAAALALSASFSPELIARRTLTMTVDFARAAAPPLSAPPPAVDQAEYLGVDYDGLSPEQQQRAAGIVAGLRRGQRLTEAQLERVIADLKALDPTFQVSRSLFSTPDSSTGYGLRLRVDVGVRTLPAQIRVGGSVQAANLIHSVDPVYPPLAKQARIQGTVRFNVVVAKDGTVEKVQLISGHPLMVEAARDAVKQYRYRPTMLNGEPISVTTQVDVNFTLNR